MEKNIQNDGLEDFLRKSFENHRESPPDDLWEKIEGNLTPPQPPAPTAPVVQPAGFQWGWLASAAIAVLLGGVMIFQQTQHRREMKQLLHEVNGNEQQLKQLENLLKEQQKLGRDFPQAGNIQPQNEGNYAPENIGSENRLQPKYETQKGKYAPGFIAGNNGDNAAIPPAHISGLTQNNPGNISPENQYIIELPTLPLSVSNPNTLAHPNLKAVEPGTAAGQLPALAVNIVPVAANREPSSWSIGANFLAMSTNERITSLRQRTQPWHGDRKLFDDDASVSGHSWMTGLSVSRELENNWSIVSGLNYRKTEFVSTHTPMLKFEDRRGHGGGPGGGGGGGGGQHEHEHDFQYDLNTPNGVVEIELRAEQIDSTQQIDDDEEVDFEVKTRQVLEYASIPVLLNYKLGNSRLHFNLTSGIIGNILLRHDFEISGAKPLNDKFRLRRDEPPTVGKHLGLRSFTVDYLACLGVEYDLTKSWSISLSPTI
ncbi:MAG: hypothetical protein AAB316_02340, partial [Bacteroidota bacterium]